MGGGPAHPAGYGKCAGPEPYTVGASPQKHKQHLCQFAATEAAWARDREAARLARKDDETMASTFTHVTLAVVGAATLALASLPGKGMRGAIVAVGACIVAAFILHFAAP
jgi:hypothetical protein